MISKNKLNLISRASNDHECRGVFRTQSNIHDETFCKNSKKSYKKLADDLRKQLQLN